MVAFGLSEFSVFAVFYAFDGKQERLEGATHREEFILFPGVIKYQIKP